MFLGFLGLNCVIPSISKDPMRLKPDGFWKFILVVVVVGDVDTVAGTAIGGGGLKEFRFSCLVEWNPIPPLFEVSGETLFSFWMMSSLRFVRFCLFCCRLIRFVLVPSLPPNTFLPPLASIASLVHL